MLQPLGIMATISYKTVELWNILFRQNNLFPHPNPLADIGQSVDPKIFQLFPSAKSELLSFIYILILLT